MLRGGCAEAALLEPVLGFPCLSSKGCQQPGEMGAQKGVGEIPGQRDECAHRQEDRRDLGAFVT